MARIRHDREFGRATFEIVNFDRREGTVQRVALREVVFPEGERRVFEVADETGKMRRIPFHRVWELWLDGAVICQRAP